MIIVAYTLTTMTRAVLQIFTLTLLLNVHSSGCIHEAVTLKALPNV